MRQILSGAIEIPTTHAPWGGVTGDGDVWRLGVDWSGAAFVAKFAVAQGGTPLITLTNAAEGSEGILASYDATLVSPASGDEVGGTVIRMTVLEATLEGLGWGSIEADKPLELFFDMLVTPVGAPQRYVLGGAVKVWKGVAD